VTHARGFTLIEVLVALVIVAFGMGAVLSALSSSAENVSALREKSMAEWIAMNRIADERLSLNPPKPGTTEGDVKAFGGEDWHWREDVVAVDAIPGMLEIAVRVTHLKPGQFSSSSGSSTRSTPSKSSSGFSSGAPGSFFSSSSGSGFSSGGFSSGLGGLSSGAAMKNLGAAALPNANNTQWVATVIGFRGDSISPPSGEQPDWSCTAGTGGLCNSTSTPTSSSSGATVNPNTGLSSGANLSTPVSGPTSLQAPPATGNSSGGSQ
jgi:type II secretion system protein I